MTVITFPATTARLAVGTRIGDYHTEWDWSEDDYGCRFRSEYEVLPADHVIDVVDSGTVRCTEDYHEACRIAAAVIDGLDDTFTVQVCISDGIGQNFIATGWMRPALAVELLRSIAP